MPVPTHFRFTVRGEFSGTPEQWSFGFHFKRNVPLGSDVQLSDINQGDVTDAITALFVGTSVGWSGLIHVLDWRAYVIGTDNRMQGNPLVVDVHSAGIIGYIGNKYPPQISLCCTLVAANRGPARFGRFFLPGPAAALDSSMRLSAADAGAYQAQVDTFLHSISDAIDLPGTVSSSAACNVSTRGGSDGTLQTIDHTECGRVLDTLRSRRTSLLEERVVGGHLDW